MPSIASSSSSYNEQHENVNGALLTLSIKKSGATSAHHQRRFTVRFGAIRPRGRIALVSPCLALTAAVVLNVLAFLCAQLALTTLLMTTSIFGVLIVFWVTHSVQYESVLVVPTVGIQNSVKYVQGREEQFIPWKCIEDVIINEVIHLNRVLYYLTVLVEDSGRTKLVPLFKYTKPRLALLENIYAEIQALLRAKVQEASHSGSGDFDSR